MTVRAGETFTFLFTDIEGSTRLWDAEPEAMRASLARHDALLARAIETAGGRVFKTVGDAFCAVFPASVKAVAAAAEIQAALLAQEWETAVPIRTRVAVHTGEAEARGGDFFGPVLNRCARLLAAAHGGQILLSSTAAELCRDSLPPGLELCDLGEHRLRDLSRAERVWQLSGPGLPDGFDPIRSLGRAPNNLPTQLPLSSAGSRRSSA